MNKKGFFFIIVAFVLLSYILTSTYYWVRAIEMEEARYSESFRVSTMEMMLSQVTEDSIIEFTNISGLYCFYRLNHHSITNPVLPAGGVDLSTEPYLDGSENENIKLAMKELMMNGTASGSYFVDGENPIEFTPDEKLVYTFEGWKSQLAASLEAAGFEVEELSIDEGTFNFTQVGFTQFEVSFNLTMRILDAQEGTSTSLVRSYEVSTIIDATGMIDPYIARESERLGLEAPDPEQGNAMVDVRVGKQIFISPLWLDEPDKEFEILCAEGENDPCYYWDDGSEGQGWFYGPVVDTTDAAGIGPEVAHSYILAGNYSEIVMLDNHENFGAYLLTNEPTETGECGDQVDTFNAIEYETDGDDPCGELTIDGSTDTHKPFVVYENFDIDDPVWEGRHLQTDQEGDTPVPKLLFVAGAHPWEVEDDPELKFQEVSVYSIENLRDFAMCGYYLPRNYSPSFLHRMFDIQQMFDTDSPAFDSWPESQWGIETLAVGRWAGGNLVDERWDNYSRVDVEFFSEVDNTVDNVQKIKGMPGCGTVYMVNMDLAQDPDFEHVGHFRLSDWSQWDRQDDSGYDDVYWIWTDVDEDDVPDNDNIGCDNDEQADCELED